MNTTAKGRRIERLCARELEKEGWTIAFKSIRTRFQPIDFAGLFDIVAIRPKTFPRHRRYIQVKSGYPPLKHILLELVDWAKKYADEHDFVELWVYRRGEWYIHRVIGSWTVMLPQKFKWGG